MFQGNLHRTGSLCEPVIQTVAGFIESKNCLSIQPNPSSDQIKISIPGAIPESSILLKINSLEGSNVFSGQLLSIENPISISFLPAGIYTVNVVSAKMQYTGRLIKID